MNDVTTMDLPALIVFAAGRGWAYNLCNRLDDEGRPTDEHEGEIHPRPADVWAPIYREYAADPTEAMRQAVRAALAGEGEADGHGA